MFPLEPCNRAAYWKVSRWGRPGLSSVILCDQSSRFIETSHGFKENKAYQEAHFEPGFGVTSVFGFSPIFRSRPRLRHAIRVAHRTHGRRRGGGALVFRHARAKHSK